jgi:acyl-lipid omega-6 desaturase (Delta-12 desaturase)
LTVTAHSWAKRLSPYRQGNDRRSSFELAITTIAFAACWVVAYKLYFVSLWLMALAMLPAGGFLVRMFMLQHDCGHNSLFQSRHVNDWIGRLIGLVTLTPYDYWRHSHAMHHAGSGNLDRRGMGDISTLTVEEYIQMGFFGRAKYRIYRNPFILFVVGPIYIFMLQQRLPFDSFRQGRASWMSVLGTNLGLLVLSCIGIYFTGVAPFFIVHLPIVFVGAAIGVWLFYVQHQFDETHWKRNPEWNHDEAALNGSSYYDLPQPFKWFSGNIGIHHLHHLSSRIPFYRLPEVLRDYPELKDMGRLTFWQSLKCIRLVLWDEAAEKLVTFRDAARRPIVQQLMAAE